jgi:hypothetical protein
MRIETRDLQSGWSCVVFREDKIVKYWGVTEEEAENKALNNIRE